MAQQQLPSAWSLFNAISGLTDADLTEAEYSVLVTLCRFTDPGGMNIHPKQRTLAACCHLCVRTVTTAISGLRRKGFLEVEYGDKGSVVHYRFNLLKLGLADPLEEAKKTIFAYWAAQDAQMEIGNEEKDAVMQASAIIQQLGIDPRKLEAEYNALH